MAIKKDGVGNDRLSFSQCDCDTTIYEDAAGNDNLVDVSCSDGVRVLRTAPMRLTAAEQAIVRKYLSILDLKRSYIAANGHLTLVLSDGTELDAGEVRGVPGDTPYVGDNGNWFIAGKDTGVLASGIAVMPRIGENGNWYLGDADTGVKAKGDDGITPHIGANGNWFVGDIDTGVKAKNEDVSLYADDLYTSGVLVTDDLESFVMTGGVGDDGKPQIVTSPGVAYIKGVRRWLNTGTRLYDVRDTDRVQAQYLRLDEYTGEIGNPVWHDVTINGDIDNGCEIVDDFTGEVIPKRSDGYYDVILCIATIPAGTTEVTPDMIRDLRGDGRYCGFVRSKVDGSAKALNEHNVSETAHSDLRLLVSGLSERLNAIADSDDTTLDQISEIVTYIKENKTLIESVTTSKVNVADIIDNLTTSVSDQPLSAKMGVELRQLISDVENGANNALSQAMDAMNQASSAQSMASSALEEIEKLKENGIDVAVDADKLSAALEEVLK